MWLLVKITLSRKGFDSSAGGVASPILPDGRLAPLPIPDSRSATRYGDVGFPLDGLVEDLTKGRVREDHGAHLDPDLEPKSLSRLPGWKPLFGQAGAAQTVLARSGVGPGDLFLFFGWFREAEYVDGVWRFVRGAPNVHLLWGWLEVGVGP